MYRKYYRFIVLLLLVVNTGCQIKCRLCEQGTSVVVPSAVVEKVTGDLGFTEGPVADEKGNIFFTDIPNNRIYKWYPFGGLSVFRENTGGANGLIFDKNGNLIACEGDNRRVVAIDPKGKVTVLVQNYDNKRLNSPNDLWIDTNGGIYFTDPRYGDKADLEQDGEHVYYLTRSGKLTRVIDDLVRPNGIIGTPDCKKLYVADHGNTWAKNENLPGNKTYIYDINPDGTLKNKTLFAPVGSDGMTLDSRGNVYLTYQPDKTVLVFNPAGQKIDTITIPETPTNVCFGGKDKDTLYITAIHSLYAVRMRVSGL